MGLRSILFAVALGTSALTLTACGDKEAKHPKIAQGPMPEGQEWAGVYYHPVFGSLHIMEEGTNIIGAWERTNQSRFGELQGVANGNVVHFKWTEKDPNFPGPSGVKKGKGYFIFKMDAENRPILEGQYGLGDEESGSGWNCVKQLNQKPDVKSVRHSPETAAPSGGF